MARKRKNRLFEEDEELKGKQLSLELAKFATRVGREAVKDIDLKRQNELITAIGILNHAQGLVGISDSRARRLLTSVKRLL